MTGERITIKKAEEIVKQSEQSYLEAVKERFQNIWKRGRPYGEELTEVTQQYVDEKRRLRDDK